MREDQQYIGGQRIGSGRLFDDLDPLPGHGRGPRSGGHPGGCSACGRRGRVGIPGLGGPTPAQKQALFLKTADIVERRKDEIVALLATETGCAAGFAGFQVLTATRLLRQAANWGAVPSAWSPSPRRGRRHLALERRARPGLAHRRQPAGLRQHRRGVKDSGWGRSGPHSMADFTELQWMTARDGTGSYPI